MEKKSKYTVRFDRGIEAAGYAHVHYVGTYAVGCPVDISKVKATLRNGLLTVNVPRLQSVAEETEEIPHCGVEEGSDQAEAGILSSFRHENP